MRPSQEQARYEALASGLDETREMLRAVVAGLVEDGFTEKQARAIVAGAFALPEDREGVE